MVQVDELLLTALAGILAIGAPKLVCAWFRAPARWLRRIAADGPMAITLAGTLGFGASAVLSLAIPHQPSIHDEFSYLYGADTFASGRLANPRHPMWRSFQSFHILQDPTGQSKFPPGQGLALAAGQWLTGRAIAGVWLSTGLACAAFCWMLRAWTTPRWALIGSLLPVFHFGILEHWWPEPFYFLYWTNTFWGGMVAALGGALLFGALRRVVAGPTIRDSVLLGAGLAILANSRPFEGLIASLPAAVVLVVWMIRAVRSGSHVVARSALPAVVVLAATGAAMAYYNHRVTGHPLRLAYQHYDHCYAFATPFVMTKRHEKPSHGFNTQRQMREQYVERRHAKARGLDGWFNVSREKLELLWQFFFGPVLTVSWITLPLLLRDRWMRFAAATCGLVLTAFLMVIPGWPHYVAPITALLLALQVHASRLLSTWRPQGRLVGRAFVRLSLVVIAASFVSAVATHAQRLAKHSDRFDQRRAAILARLSDTSGLHLVVVRYAPDHFPHHEWVYNKADIDAAKVVWAREVDSEHDARLRAYFADRTIWLLEPDLESPTLRPFSAAEPSRRATKG